MRREQLSSAFWIGLTLLVGAVVWWLQLRPALRVDASRLGALPLEIGAWRGASIPLEATVERILRADFNLQRAYQRQDDAEPVWLYVGYYGTERGGRPEHTPAQCYPSAGWQIETARALDAPPLRGNEWIVAQQGERQLVLFWYQSARRSGMLGDLEISADHLAGRLKEGRADGALVRLSTPLSPDEASARARLLEFARALDALLAERWPNEFPAGSS